jgi:hypothetical protein
LKSLAKSFLMAFMGTGLFFCFLMMVTVPSFAFFARWRGDVQKTAVVVEPGMFLRAYGVPAALILFVILFAYGIHRFRREGQHTLAGVRE